MKTIYKTTLLFFLLFLFTKNSFAQYPFYGFELSNYEVGDTLEYASSYLIPNGSFSEECMSTDVYVIINKKYLGGNDSLQYTMRDIKSYECGYMYGSQGADTIQSVINNDTVYNNRNNLLYVGLSLPDTMGIGKYTDSFYVRYDTINGLKELKMELQNVYVISNFEVIENIGVINSGLATEDQMGDYGLSLIYAHLAHYGIFGTYQNIPDGVDNSIHPQTNISIRYDNSGNPLLFYSSNENVVQPILAVYDLLGRKVELQPVNVGSNLIDMNNLSAGMYVYKVQTDERIIGQGKFVNTKK